jgi:serine/threonine protein kinase
LFIIATAISLSQMSLAVGTKVGPYEITGTLGAGGMGEVYRAHDARLACDVALKVLSDTFAGDAERLARFQREAQFPQTASSRMWPRALQRSPQRDHSCGWIGEAGKNRS